MAIERLVYVLKNEKVHTVMAYNEAGTPVDIDAKDAEKYVPHADLIARLERQTAKLLEARREIDALKAAAEEGILASTEMKALKRQVEALQLLLDTKEAEAKATVPNPDVFTDRHEMKRSDRPRKTKV